MAIFGKNGFIRKQEMAFARKLIVWKYEKAGAALPGEAVLAASAEKIVDEAHILAQKSGRNVLGVLKETIRDIRRK